MSDEYEIKKKLIENDSSDSFTFVSLKSKFKII